MRIPDDAIERILVTWPVARLATRGPDDRPHVVPVVFARAGGRLWSPVDGKPKAGGELARVRNVRRDPRVSLLLDHYQADWTLLWWVRLDGEATLATPSAPESDPEVAPALAALRRKYPQYRELPLLGEPPTLLTIQVRSRRAWCAGPAAVARLATHPAVGDHSI